MKFLFLSSYAHLALDRRSDRVSGGAELQVALLARELVKRGQDVTVVGGDVGQPDGIVLDGVRTRNGGKFQTGGLGGTAASLPRVFHILRQEKPDYALILGWTAWLFFLHLMKPALGYKLVFICGLDTEVNGEFRRQNPARGALFEYGVKKSDIRYAMSGYQEEMFHRKGQSCALYRNLILPRSSPRCAAKTVDLLWVARCQPIKRPHRFLDLIERMPGAAAEMICPREDAALWESVSARAKTLPNLTFHERVPYHEIQHRYDAARIFVNTSTHEGWPNSFIQSGLGRTALLSLEINPDDLFGRFRLGMHAAGDFERLAAAAAQMLGNPTGLDQMQQECERFVRELHDNEKNVDAFAAGLRLRD